MASDTVQVSNEDIRKGPVLAPAAPTGKKEVSPQKVIVGGGVGGAIGLLLVIMVPKFSSLTFAGDEGAMVAAATGIIFSWVVTMFQK